MIINHNLNAMNAHRQLGINTVNAGKSMEKLSSGLRINRAGDDAAGLSISEKMRAQIRGLDQAARNAQDGISLIQTAEGALQETHAILQRMREIAVQAANDTNVEKDREAIQNEINQFTQEIDRIGNTTEFNTQKLLDAGEGLSATLQVGANKDQTFSITIKDMRAAALGLSASGTGATKEAKVTGSEISDVKSLNFSDTNLKFKINDKTITLSSGYSDEKTIDDLKTDLQTVITNAGLTNITVGVDGNKLTLTSDSDIKIEDATSGNLSDIGLTAGTTTATASASTGIDVSNSENANLAIETIDNAIAKVSEQRSQLGAYQNRLEHTIANLGTSSENLTAAESRIRDVDMAKEMMAFSKNNILAQAAQAMLAQANQQPQGVLQLLR